MSLAKWAASTMGAAGALVRLSEMPAITHGAKVPFPWADKSAYKNRFTDREINRAINAPAPIETVRLDELHAIQHSVVPERVKQYIVNPAMQALGTRNPRHRGLVDFPIVVEYRGEKYIHDGHHRLTALWLRGKATAKVRFVALGGHDA